MSERFRRWRSDRGEEFVQNIVWPSSEKAWWKILCEQVSACVQGHVNSELLMGNFSDYLVEHRLSQHHQTINALVTYQLTAVDELQFCVAIDLKYLLGTQIFLPGTQVVDRKNFCILLKYFLSASLFYPFKQRFHFQHEWGEIRQSRKAEGERINLVRWGDKEQTLKQHIMEVNHPIERK